MNIEMPILLSYCKNTVILILSAFFIISCNAEASDLRGRVDASHRYTNNKVFSVSRAKVTLYRIENMTEVQRTLTGTDGMYYFRNIGSGKYLIKVETPYGSSEKRITVHDESLKDIPLILITQ